MSGWVSREEASVHYPGTEPFETAARWTPALGDGSCRFFGDFREVAACYRGTTPIQNTSLSIMGAHSRRSYSILFVETELSLVALSSELELSSR